MLKSSGTAAATCTYKGKEYSKGSTVCMINLEMKCGDNGWYKTGKSCKE